MLVLKGLAEDVKLSAYGRSSITFMSFSFCLFLFCSLTNTSPTIFYDAFFFFFWYGWSSALFFRANVVASKFVGVLLPHLFLFT